MSLLTSGDPRAAYSSPIPDYIPPLNSTETLRSSWQPVMGCFIRPARSSLFGLTVLRAAIVLVLNHNNIYEATDTRKDERRDRFNSGCEENCVIGLLGSAIAVKILRP